MLHPDSVLRLLWSLAGVTFLFLDFCFLTMGVFDIVRPPGLELADASYWTCEVDMSAKNIARAYARGWF